MSPQFVDLDADGNLDIVCGIYDGSPHVARGDGAGSWLAPEWILDRNGARIVGNMFWDFDAKQWRETTRCDPAGGAPAHAHLTSAIAMDIDGDGDLDLVLGDHDNGHVYVRRNEGTASEARFTTFNELLLADGRPMRDPGTVATLRAVDWNGDGRLDLMVSGMGDTHGAGPGGGVVVHPNVGDGAAARFGPAVVLIEPSPRGWREATRPDVGLHPEPVDFDGDGDLDLIVGGYSQWTPVGREPTDDERAELRRIDARMLLLGTRIAERNRAMLEAQQGLSREQALQVRLEMAKDPERKRLFDERAALTARKGEIVPAPQRVSFVWLYENVDERDPR